MFVISTPRTASTLYCEMTCADNALLHQISTKLATGLYNREIFDVTMYSQEQIYHRFEQYKQLEIKPLIKIFPGMTPNFILQWFLENDSPIFIERHDKLDQILSWGLGTYTKKWNTKRTSNFDKIEYLYPDFAYIASVIQHYEETKSKVLNPEVILTESVKTDIKTRQLNDRTLPQENSEVNKIQFYSNNEQIMEWYNDWHARTYN